MPPLVQATLTFCNPQLHFTPWRAGLHRSQTEEDICAASWQPPRHAAIRWQSGGEAGRLTSADQGLPGGAGGSCAGWSEGFCACIAVICSGESGTGRVGVSVSACQSQTSQSQAWQSTHTRRGDFTETDTHVTERDTGIQREFVGHR
eukprot:1810043-Rhodomonas_salina.2